MNSQIAIVDEFERAAVLAKDLAEAKPFRRAAYKDLAADLVNFARAPRLNSSWIIMPGLRGVGKTTLLAQLYSHPCLAKEKHRFYLSLDSPVGRNIDYAGLVRFLENQLNSQLHQAPGKVFLFLDEIHFWSGDWSLDLKVLYDNFQPHGGLFMVCTGSSALRLNLNPDSGRRVSRIMRIPPLSLTESILLETQVRRQQLRGRSRQTEAARCHLDQIGRYLSQYLESDLAGGNQAGVV